MSDDESNGASASAAKPKSPPKDQKKEKKGTSLIPKMPECGFLVQGSKNGGYPIRTEKRSYKKVTIIDNVQGKAETLCKELKNKLGAGATVRLVEGKMCVELQGDGHTERLKKLLRGFGCLKGVALTDDEKKDMEQLAKIQEPERVRLKPRHKKEEVVGEVEEKLKFIFRVPSEMRQNVLISTF